MTVDLIVTCPKCGEGVRVGGTAPRSLLDEHVDHLQATRQATRQLMEATRQLVAAVDHLRDNPLDWRPVEIAVNRARLLIQEERVL